MTCKQFAVSIRLRSFQSTSRFPTRKDTTHGRLRSFRDTAADILAELDAAINFIVTELRTQPLDVETRTERLAERRRYAEQRDVVLAAICEADVNSLLSLFV